MRKVAVLLLVGFWSLGVRAELPEFRQLVAESAQAVVKILVESKVEAPSQGNLEQMPEYLRRYFEFRGGPGAAPQQRRYNAGSGFVISEDGYVVTNNHVVEGASSVVVMMQDRREFDAEIIGLDERSDLALLKIDAEGLPTVALAKDDVVEVGEWVLAIGSPFGLDFSVTAGIVSAKGRSLPTERGENYVPFLQTDVAINPGNSGGPLFNLAGEVVGVNSQIFTRSGGSIGLSFSIPAAVVRNVIAQLKASGQVVRGWLGVSIQDVDRNLAESFGLDRPRGALIAQVGPESPAAKAGLLAGDIILRFDDKAIETSADLPHVVGLIAPGTSVIAEVLREGDELDVEVEVGGLDADERASIAGVTEPSGAPGRALGLVLEEAESEMMAQYGLSGGVVVLEVTPGSAAEDAGLLGGDVITRLGSQAIMTLADMDRVAGELQPGQSVAVRLLRRGSPLFLAIRIPSPE